MTTPDIHGPGLDPNGALPLAAQRLFATRDIDEARERVAQVYCDHRLETLGRSDFDAQHNRLSGAKLSLNVMTYGAKAMISPGALGDFYLFQFPIRGHASVRNGDNRHEIGQGTAGVLNPEDETCMIWSEDCVQVMLQVRRDVLTEMARASYGLPAQQALRFQGAGDMTNGPGRALAELLGQALRAADRGEALIGGQSMLSSQFEGMLLAALLDSQPHNLQQPEVREGTGPVPRIVRVAEDFMEANLFADLTLEMIAKEVGASPRGLQAAFRAARGRSPMTVHRDMRLDRAWMELSTAGPDTNVTDVAMTLGFFHLGRFAEHYRQKFGCTPVQTLRYARSL